MKTPWRKWLLTAHRDVGYFFAGITLVYCISGIALNHRDDWTPSFVVEKKTVPFAMPGDRVKIDSTWVKSHLQSAGITDSYRAHDFPSPEKMKVFLKDGSLMVDAATGEGEYESLRRRPLFYQINRLHLNPNRVWTFFSDAFCLGLGLITVTGLFLARGRYGFLWRGAAFTGGGFLVLIGFLLFLS
jgi:uncharacterized protein